MNKNRFFNLVVIVSLAVMAALTIGQVAATNRLVSAASNGGAAADRPLADEQCSAVGVDRSSIHMVYVERSGAWMPYTQDGPTGVDGGLIELLSNRRDCSK